LTHWHTEAPANYGRKKTAAEHGKKNADGIGFEAGPGTAWFLLAKSCLFVVSRPREPSRRGTGRSRGPADFLFRPAAPRTSVGVSPGGKQVGPPPAFGGQAARAPRRRPTQAAPDRSSITTFVQAGPCPGLWPSHKATNPVKWTVVEHVRLEDMDQPKAGVRYGGRVSILNSGGVCGWLGRRAERG